MSHIESSKQSQLMQEPPGSPQEGSSQISSSLPAGVGKTTYSKRGKITVVACVSCRKRKTKCDGKRPICSQCLTRHEACIYDMTDEQRRLTYLRECVEQLEEDKTNLEKLLYSIQRADEATALKILYQLRSGSDIYHIAREVDAKSIREGNEERKNIDFKNNSSLIHSRLRLDQYESFMRTLPTCSDIELEEIIRRLKLHEDVSQILNAISTSSLLQPLNQNGTDTSQGLEAAYSGVDQTFGLVKGTRGSHAPQLQDIRRCPVEAHSPLNNSPWTQVTDDQEFIEHLLSLYFSWQHSFFQSFPEKLFREDMAAGRTKYCSTILVNAICAAGCLLSSRPEARRDPNNSMTAGLDFFEEAVKQVNETSTSTMPTTAALYLLCHVDGHRGKLSSLWMYSGRSSRMALDMNLHLRSDKSPHEKVSADAHLHERARLHAFWGSFIGDSVSSFTLGRLPQIPTNAITVDLPPVIKEDDEEGWVAYGIKETRKPGAKSSTFVQVATLSKIVNSTLQMFFAPSQTLSGTLLLNEYSKYQRWYNNLPTFIQSINNAPPHVLCLHMYYQAAVLLLFRPFLKATFKNSKTSPRELCRKSANEISDIFARHKSLYNLNGIYTFQVHCLLTACTIHIINVPTISATNYLTAACDSFQDLVHHNEWAVGSLNIIKGLVQKWGIILPLEAETALYRNSGSSSQFDFSSDGGESENFRPEKRANYLNPSTQVMQKRQRLAPRETREQPTNYLFAPFPNQPAPLLGPMHTSTSGDIEWNDELSKIAQSFDGLVFGDDWYDPFMGYQGD